MSAVHQSDSSAAVLNRLVGAREAIARRWLLRVLDSMPLHQVRRMPADRIARELPNVVVDIVESAAGRQPRGAAEAELASRFVGLVMRDAGTAGDAARDVAVLQAAMFAALRQVAAGVDDETFAAAADRLASTFAAMQRAAVEELVVARCRELERLANTDALTGLHNLRYLRRQLGQLTAVHERYGHPFSLLLLDVDGLKRVNDAHGHAAGDRLLKEVAGVLRRTVRGIDTPVRLGGDEFCVLAIDQTAEWAEVLARRVLAEVERVPEPDGARAGVSIGVASCPEHGTEPEPLLELADAAMYRAKAATAGVAVAGVDPLREPAGVRPE